MSERKRSEVSPPPRRSTMRGASPGGRKSILSARGGAVARRFFARRSSSLIPSFPLSPRHSRESGNPDDCDQAHHPKSSVNRERQIPSPIKGLQGQVSDFGMADDLYPVRRRQPRFGRRRDAAAHPALSQKAVQRSQDETKRASEMAALRRGFRRRRRRPQARFRANLRKPFMGEGICCLRFTLDFG